MKLTLTVLLLYLSGVAYSQPPHPSVLPPNPLEQLYQESKIGLKTYMDSTPKVVMKFMLNGALSDGKGLITYLQHYREKAWSKVEYKEYRASYYRLLGNNARFQNRNGEALYYFEKLDKELNGANSGDKAFYILGQICYLHGQNSNYETTIEAFEAKSADFQTVRAAYQNGAIDDEGLSNVFNILAAVTTAYVELLDTMNTEKTIVLAQTLLEAFLEKNPLETRKGTIASLLIEGMKFRKYYDLLKDTNQVRRCVKNMGLIISNNPKLPIEWRNMLLENYYMKKIEYLLTTKQNDSALYYIKRLEQNTNVSFNTKATIYTFKATLMHNLGKHDSALIFTNLLLEEKDKISNGVMQDLDELLYAHTQAENDRTTLIQTQKEKENRTILVFVTILVSLAIFLVIFWLSKVKDKKARQQIEKLNSMTNLLIAEMEEVKSEERRAEQIRLGRDLHDNLSASVTAVKLQIEAIANTTGIHQLKSISNHLKTIYETIRNKSHDLSFHDESDAAISFEGRITTLINHTLLHENFATKIVIDEMALYDLTMDDKIHLLRIIQEAIINILKHAKASKIDILMYQSDYEKVLQIQDNGKGFDPHSISGKHLGLNSMQARVAQLQGKMEIESGKKGTLLTIKMKTVRLSQ